MKILAGKFYKTRSGRRAFIGAVNPPSPFGAHQSDKWPFAGYIEGDIGGSSWTIEGTTWPGMEDEDDLVAACDDAS